MMNFCPNCGNKLNKGMHVCPNCGIRLDGDSAQAMHTGNDIQDAGNAARRNDTPSGAQGAAFDDWGSGTIFVNPDADQSASYSYAAPGRPQPAEAYAQPVEADAGYGAPQQQEDAWNDGTVFADQAAFDGYPVHDVQQAAGRAAAPVRAAVNPYQEQRIQTPYTPPVQKPEKQRKAKTVKKEKVKTVKTAKTDGGSLRDTVIRIAALVIVAVCIVVGVMTGGF